MKKLIKWLLISIALIIVLVFANGCYYVFRGQERSMAKLEQGRELNLYASGCSDVVCRQKQLDKHI